MKATVLEIIEACESKDPNMSAAVPADMIRRGLSLEQISAELQGIEITAVEQLPQVATSSFGGPSLAARMLSRLTGGKTPEVRGE
jgi:hypothetical protein